MGLWPGQGLCLRACCFRPAPFVSTVQPGRVMGNTKEVKVGTCSCIQIYTAANEPVHAVQSCLTSSVGTRLSSGCQQHMAGLTQAQRVRAACSALQLDKLRVW